MAVTISIVCPSCYKKFKGRSELRGKKVRCPVCDHAFVVDARAIAPEDEAASKKASAKSAPASAGKPKPDGKRKPAAAASKTPPATDDEDEYGESNPYGVTELDIAPRCPHCANEMESADAVVCLFCGYNTETREIGKTQTVYAITPGEHFKWLLPGLANAVGIIALTVFCFFFSVWFPHLVKPKSWWALLDHESMRMWFTLIALGIMWPLGYFAYKRLILQPKPVEKKKE